MFAGAFNGLLLPFGIGVLLWVATFRADLLNGYRYPRWLLVVGWLAWLLTLYLAMQLRPSRHRAVLLRRGTWPPST